jgi:hypothetical protein
MRSEEGARAVKRAHSIEMLSRPGVVGFGVEHDSTGEPVLTIHVDSDDPQVLSSLPAQIEDYPVKVVHQPGGFHKFSAEDVAGSAGD